MTVSIRFINFKANNLIEGVGEMRCLKIVLLIDRLGLLFLLIHRLDQRFFWTFLKLEFTNIILSFK